MAGKQSRRLTGRNNRQTHSKITGKKFNRQDPTVRRHGPKHKRQVYQDAIEWALQDYFGTEGGWLSSAQIAEIANKKVSNHWTQLSGFSVGAILRTAEANGNVISKRNGTTGVKSWKFIKNFHNPEKRRSL